MTTVIVCAGILIVAGCAMWLGYCLGRAAECDARAKAAERRSADEALTESRKARAEAAAKLAEANDLVARLREHRAWIEENAAQLRAAVYGRLNGDR